MSNVHLPSEVLNAYLDAALPTAERAAAEAHLATCPLCAQELAALQAVFARLQAWPAQPLPRDFATAVTQQLRARATATPWVLPRQWQVALALQALIALAVLGFFTIEAINLVLLPTLPPPPAWPTPWLVELQQFAQQFTHLGQGLAPTASTLTWGFSLTVLGLAWLLGSGWLLRTIQRGSPSLQNHL